MISEEVKRRKPLGKELYKSASVQTRRRSIVTIIELWQTVVAMTRVSPRKYAALPSVQGMRLIRNGFFPSVTCPLCGSADTALLMGNLNFSAKMTGANLCDDLPLAAFICSESHVFFLRERDICRSQGSVD